MVFKWIHFVILAGLVYWVFGKLLPPVFRRNADNISSAITKATAAKVEAERKLQEAVTKMGNLEREIAEFRVQAQRDAAAEVERLRGATILDVEKIRTAAKAEIEAAERAARVELKELAAKLAVDGAESLVAKQMTPAVQEATISSFVQSLQGRPN
jgi:F-type H+-transporting ATPase subunit b